MKTKLVGLIPNTPTCNFSSALRTGVLLVATFFNCQLATGAPDEWIEMQHYVPASTVAPIGGDQVSFLAPSCRPSVQVSLNQQGWALITPGMLVIAPEYDLDQYEVDIMGPLSDTVFCDQIGEEVMAAVEELPTENICMSSLIVEDKLKPVLECTNDTLACNVVISELDFLSFIDTVYDNCDDDVEVYYAYTITELDCDPDGVAAYIEVTYTAEDNFGYINTCEQLIVLEKFTLDDVEFPVDTSLDCENANIDPGVTGEPTIDGEPIHHFCELVAWKTDQLVDMCAGEQKVIRTWNVMDWCTGQTISDMQEILIIDTVPPAITCPDDITLGTDPGECLSTYTFPDPDVSDNCSDAPIDVRFNVSTVPGMFFPDDELVLELGDHVITVSATDDCNNTSTCTYTVTVVDDENPVLVCSAFSTNLNAMGMSTLVAAAAEFTVFDNCEVDSVAVRRMDDFCGVPEDLVFGPSVKFCCADIGQTVLIVFQAIDVAGNTATCMVPVEVKDVDPPTALCRDIMAFLDGNGEVSIDPLDVDDGSFDNCEIISYELDDDSFDCEDVGPNVVVLTVEDQSGNTATCSATVTVKDTLPPTAVCVDITVDLDQNGMAMIIPEMVDGGSFDNCELDTLIVTPNMFDCDDVGVQVVELIVIDVAGTSDTCEATVTVMENPPMVECMDATVYVDENGEVSITPSDVDAVSDDCGVMSLEVDPSDFTCDNIGPNVVVLTATDNDGNTATCSATVTVLDTISPSCNTQDITVQLDANGMVSIAENAVDDGSDDNCDVDQITVDPDDFTCTHVGQNIVTQTVTDVNGNVSTCTAIVTVQDTVSPECLAQDITVFLDAGGSVNIAGNAVDAGSNDACGIADIDVDPNSFNCGNVGDNPVTQTVTDVNGNTSSCTATVTVIDTVSPTCFTMDITVQLDANGMVSIAGNAVDNGSSDACGVQSITVTPDDFTCADVGTVIVVQTVTDVNGNTSTCTANVTVEDVTDPTCVAQDITVFLDDGGAVSITGPDVDNGSSDACGIMDLTVTPGAFDCDDVGGNGVTLVVTDVNGNSSSCTATVTVMDTITPVCSTMDITVQLDANGMASIGDNAVDDGSSDACGIADITLDQTDFTCADVGVVIVVQTVTDNNGNVSTCTANVTIEDVTDPTCLTQDITVFLDAAGNASIANNAVDNGSSDACGVATITVDPSSFGCVNVGDVMVTQTVTDVNGNSASCTATVTVMDTVSPTCITTDISVQLDNNGMASIDSNAVDDGSSDACGIVDIDVTPSTFDCDDVGEVIVTQTVTDANGNESTCTATVTVQENQLPICSAINITVHLDADGMASIDSNGVDNGSSDACGIAEISADPSTFDCGDVGQVIVTQTVTDVGGNTATCTAVVTVMDTVSPVCSTMDITIQLDANGMASIDSNAVDNGSTDACGITEINVTPSDFTCDDVGQVVVVQTVTDVNGNTASCTATVTVENNEDPVATCNDITVFLDVNGMVSITAADIDGGSSTNCGDIDLEIDITDFDCTDIGDNIVTLTVTDGGGSTSTCTATVTVVDDLDPTCSTQDITIQLDAMGSASITAGDVDNGSDDNCGPLTLDVDPTDFTCADTGPNVVVLTVTDGSGNSSTCTATVTVEDTIAPTCVAMDITVLLDGSGNASITANDIDNGSTDNCPPVDLSVDPTDFTCDDLGPNEVVLTVTDPSGNTSTCTATVTVEDDANLQAICQNLTVFLDVNGMVSITPDLVDNGSGGGCASGTIMLDLDQENFDCSDVGPNVVVLTVTDQEGNTATCTAVITVVDNIPPELICPVDMTANCDDVDPGDLSPFGTPTVDDNCPNPMVNEMTVFNTDNCGVGTIVRTFTATDASGNTTECIQVITVTNPDPLTEDDIIWPAAVINLPECSETGPGDIPNSQPVIDLDAGSCANVTVISMDSTVTTCDTLPQTPCVEIYRTWIVTDTCQLEPGTDNGIFTYLQTIFVNDSVGPMFQPIADITVEADTPECTAFVSLMAFATACGMPVDIVNDFNDGGANASGEFPVGTTTVTFTAEDECCNVSTLSVDITVLDPIDPTVQCNKVIFNIPPELELAVFAEDFVTFTPGGCADADDYFFSYSNNDPFDSVIIVNCAQAGDVIPIDIYTYDPNGILIDSCLGDLDLRDSMDLCGSGLTITGLLYDENGLVIPDATVLISDENMPSAFSNTTGRFTFVNLVEGNSYVIGPYDNDNHKEGVSTLDLVTIHKHLLGISELGTPYQRIAADVTNNGRISAIDLLEIRKLILGVITEYQNNTSWRFVDADFKFPDPFDPFMIPFPEEMHFDAMSEHYTGADFVGIKIGDVNGSVLKLTSPGPVETRSASTRVIRVQDQVFQRGDIVRVPVVIPEFSGVVGYQFALDALSGTLQLMDVEPTTLLNDMYFSDPELHHGSMRTLWYAAEETSLHPDTELFTLVFRAVQDGQLSDYLALDETSLLPEIYVAGEEVDAVPLHLEFARAADEGHLQLFQNRPNPFAGTTEIPFYLPTDDRVDLLFHSVDGRLVHQITQTLPQGYHTVEIANMTLGSSGLYYYTMVTSAGRITKKMTLLD